MSNEVKPYKLSDHTRSTKKGLVASSLQELIEKGKKKLSYAADLEVYLVLEEDGTVVDEEDYFGTLPDQTQFILMPIGQRWTPFGPSAPRSSIGDETDSSSQRGKEELLSLLERLRRQPGLFVALNHEQLEALAEMDVDALAGESADDLHFLENLQTSANERILLQMKVRDGVGLIKMYHDAEADIDSKP